MFTSPFGSNKSISIPSSAEIVFVSDMFSSDHVGGAELTTDAIIDASPYNVFRLHSKDVDNNVLSQGIDKFWIFGNFSSIDHNIIPGIIANIKYGVVEYDYKYCKYRSPEKHKAAENKECDCDQQINGKMISAFYYGAKQLWWMSEGQKNHYHDRFPFLSDVKNKVLSSVFNEDFFKKVSSLVKKNSKKEKNKWIVIGSDSWIKGTQDGVDYCKSKNLDYEVLNNVPYSDLLEKLSLSKGLVFLPRGKDTCPRLVIEAKLLGCDLIINDNVQHAKEEWFDTQDIDKTLKHLYFSREVFWSDVKEIIEFTPTLSGYTTTLNCVDQNYPFEASVKSMLEFCNQVVVVDGGSTDGTWEVLENLARENKKLIIHKQERDMSSKRFAVFDGLQKALARALCTGDFCWQQDSDEILHERDYEKVSSLMRKLPKTIDLVCLPVIEFWGKGKKVRIDVNPWKWRLSRNRPHITHGIPKDLRKFDKDGNLYASPGTDGCDYIRSDTFEPIQFSTFYTSEGHEMRTKAMLGDKDSFSKYAFWLHNVVKELPTIYHYSWFDLSRKIRTYRDYWSKHWQSLYDIEQKDTKENNMFFDKPWSKVKEAEIVKLSEKLEEEMGGWIFHSKIDFEKPTPSIGFGSSHPELIQEWIEK